MLFLKIEIWSRNTKADTSNIIFIKLFPKSNIIVIKNNTIIKLQANFKNDIVFPPIILYKETIIVFAILYKIIK